MNHRFPGLRLLAGIKTPQLASRHATPHGEVRWGLYALGVAPTGCQSPRDHLDDMKDF